MTRTPVRLFALWAWTVLLLNGSVDAFGVHPCPHHSVVAHAVASAAGGEHDDAHAHGADARGDGAETSGEDHEGTCTCVGSCAMGTTAPLPAPPTFRAAPVAPSPRATPRDASELRPALLPFVLPYATAPPSRLS